jgi:hypothetical protein
MPTSKKPSADKNDFALDERTIAGELCSYSALTTGLKGEFCSWDRLENWQFIGDGRSAFYLQTTILNIKQEATQIELAPVIAPDTFNIPSQI